MGIVKMAKAGLGTAIWAGKKAHSTMDRAMDVVAVAIVDRAMATIKHVRPVVYEGKPRSKSVIPIELTGTFLRARKLVITNLKPTDELYMEMCPSNTRSSNAVGVFVNRRIPAQLGWVPEAKGVAKKYFYFLKMGKKLEIVNWNGDFDHFIIYVK